LYAILESVHENRKEISLSIANFVFVTTALFCNSLRFDVWQSITLGSLMGLGSMGFCILLMDWIGSLVSRKKWGDLQRMAEEEHQRAQRTTEADALRVERKPGEWIFDGLSEEQINRIKSSLKDKPHND
jgi:hypothetical protein